VESEEAVRQRLVWVNSLGPALVCASRGAQGCIAYDGAHFYHQAAKPVTQMRDTMGAGDSLLTAFLVGYLSRKKGNMEQERAVMESLDAAAAFAAAVCGTEGSWGHGKKY
jgi:sugar/nucleoside kinase (ribokinase family)